MVAFLYRRAHPRIVQVGQHADGTLRDRSRFNLAPLAPDVLAVRIDSALNFLTAVMLERFIGAHCRQHGNIRRVLLCAGSINDIDASGIETLGSLHQALQRENIELYMSAIKKQVWDVMDRTGIIDTLGPAHIFATDSEAITSIRSPNSLVTTDELRSPLPLPESNAT
jgi:SulP family sulfate permease